MKVCVDVRTPTSDFVESIVASPDGTIRCDAYFLMKSHSASVRKPESTSTSGLERGWSRRQRIAPELSRIAPPHRARHYRSDMVVISTILWSPGEPSVTGIGTWVLWPMRTPGQMNWPPT